MKINDLYVKVVLGAIAAALVKVAFFPAARPVEIIPQAHAQSTGVIEWKDSRRIVSVGDDGATTYVWDYDDKTKVRRYSIKGGKLVLESFKLDE